MNRSLYLDCAAGWRMYCHASTSLGGGGVGPGTVGGAVGSTLALGMILSPFTPMSLAVRSVGPNLRCVTSLLWSLQGGRGVTRRGCRRGKFGMYYHTSLLWCCRRRTLRSRSAFNPAAEVAPPSARKKTSTHRGDRLRALPLVKVGQR